MADDKGTVGASGEIDAIDAFLKGDTIDKAFGNQDMVNALRMLILSDPDIMQMLFRFRLPSRRYAVAAGVLWGQYADHGYEKGLNQIKLILGFGSNVNDERINALVQAITAERKEKQGGMGDRLQKFIEGIGNK